MSEIFDDTSHPINFISPIGGDLVVQSMSGDEAIGRLFNYNLELLSHDFELQFSQVVGQQVTVALDLPVDKRYFNGYITEFRYMGQTDRFARYQATLRPWFWFLTRTSDCRIFQEQKVPDIIKDIFQEHGMSDVEYRLRGTYREWEYCVQYRETDFNFISRLMEQEGIYYYFEHFEDKHMLILTDEVSTHSPFPQFETIPYHSSSGQLSAQIDDHLQYWAVTQLIQPETYATKDFDFKNPEGDLFSILMQPGDHAFPIEQPEIFDYPGEYTERPDGENYVEIRLQELRSQHERVSGGGPCRGISAGCLFTLMEYPREDQNKEYLVLSVSHQINDTSYISGGGGIADELYRCQIEVMDSTVSYRQARSTPKPIVQGPQTAIVVGRDNDEIFTDKYGRVKVQFHWDRYGQRNENSSCWIRVSQLWAGAKWGGIHIPRVDQEVIVSFMEGDPDKPVITGRVYNDDCMPPYDLPANKTQSGIKSRSSKDGTSGNFNEIRMEDKKGSEELYFHAEKNHTAITENDRTATVERGNDKITVQAGTRSVTVKGNTSLTVQAGDRIVDVTGNYKLDTTSEISMQAPNKITLTCGASKITMEPGKITISAGGGASMTLDANALTKSSAGSKVLLDGNAVMGSPGEAKVEAPTAILSGGGSTVTNTGSGIQITSGGIIEQKGAIIKHNA